MDLGIIATGIGFLIVMSYNAVKTHKAERQTRETGNGFADKVMQEFRLVHEENRRVEGKIDRHLETHAESDVLKR